MGLQRERVKERNFIISIKNGNLKGHKMYFCDVKGASVSFEQFKDMVKDSCDDMGVGVSNVSNPFTALKSPPKKVVSKPKVRRSPRLLDKASKVSNDVTRVPKRLQFEDASGIQSDGFPSQVSSVGDNKVVSKTKGKKVIRKPSIVSLDDEETSNEDDDECHPDCPSIVRDKKVVSKTKGKKVIRQPSIVSLDDEEEEALNLTNEADDECHPDYNPEPRFLSSEDEGESSIDEDEDEDNVGGTDDHREVVIYDDDEIMGSGMHRELDEDEKVQWDHDYGQYIVEPKDFSLSDENIDAVPGEMCVNMVFDDIPTFKKHVREYAVMKKMHLYQNYIDHGCKGPKLRDLLWNAAKAYKKSHWKVRYLFY
ncbi:hypothetical protein MKW98_022524 [Papaver atlanticum]|uniref:Uncharacterized protein n=1 Tax=Papaver atlanticum TaxID=357466 RepID=A0AAD4XY19_9MAGN|nr:hypothetical protein MKW98_022524 [Papaver atlanticum]